jgi:nucleoside-diphosphate-sugar epimerase
MIAVVTGSTGFIGSHLVDALLARGDTVRALVRPETPLDRRDPRIPCWEADLLDDRSVRSAGIWDGATHVFHLAGITKGRTLAEFRAGNVFPTVNLLAALAAREMPRPRVVLLSSQAAAGPAKSAEAPVRETDRPVPVEAYGRSKLQGEQAAIRYGDSLPITVVRPAAVYGPRDRDFLRVFRQALRPVALHAAPQRQLFSLVFVSDLVRALLLAAESEAAAGQTYFVGGDRPVSWRELYDAIAAAGGSSPRQLQVPLAAVRAAARGGDLLSVITGRATLLNHNKAALARQRFWLCDSSAAREQLGWFPVVPLQEGVRETYLSYLQAGWLRSTRPSAADEATGDPTE